MRLAFKGDRVVEAKNMESGATHRTAAKKIAKRVARAAYGG